MKCLSWKQRCRKPPKQEIETLFWSLLMKMQSWFVVGISVRAKSTLM